MRTWLHQPLGECLRAAELSVLAEHLPDLYGFYAVQLGYWGPERELLGQSRVLNSFLMFAPGSDYGEHRPDLVARPRHLPFASGSVDAVILPHTLERAERPHHVLREIDRILIPDGHVVVLGLNPFSLWGIPRLALGQRGGSAWCDRYISEGRVTDWLTLLGYEIQSVERFMYRPPVRQAGMLNRLRFMETWGRRFWPHLGAAYLVVAQKRVKAITPLRPRWRPQRQPFGQWVGSSTVNAARERRD